MTLPQDPSSDRPAGPSTTQLPPAPTGPLRPPRRSCASRLLGLIGWLLTLALSVLLALAAAAALLYFYFGLNLSTPAQLRQASGDVSALQARAEALETQVALQATAAAEDIGALAGARERIDELERQAGELAAQAATAEALAQDLDEGLALAATIQAEGREGQVLVAVVATIQAGNTDTLADLQRRTDRLVRFLQRLGDITGDATLDESPLPLDTTATPTPAAGADETPTPTPAAGADETPTPTPTP